MAWLPQGLGKLVRQVQSGSEDALSDLCDRCRQPLVKVINSVLPPAVRKIVDPDDLLDRALLILREKQLPEEILDSDNRTWAYLKRIVIRLTHRAVRMCYSKRHDIRREESMSRPEKLLSPDPSPEQEFALREMAEKVARLPWKERTIIELKQEHQSERQIAHRMGLDRNHVRRTIKGVEERLNE